VSHYILAICFDFGDTLVDEGSEVKDDTLMTLSGDLIPGADRLVRELKRRGYPLALVADGKANSYYNVLTQHGLYDLFDAFAVSEQLGVEKPHPRMFVHALEQLGIAREDYGRTVMVGNYLSRDVKGANEVGLISVWLDWAPRRPKVPADPSEVPQYTIKTPLDLLPLIEALEREKEMR